MRQCVCVYFSAVVGWTVVSFTYFIYIDGHFSPVVPNLRNGLPPKGHRINLWGCGVIIEEVKKEQDSEFTTMLSCSQDNARYSVYHFHHPGLAC